MYFLFIYKFEINDFQTCSNKFYFTQVIIGHDWGSFISGRFALWHPDRVLALSM